MKSRQVTFAASCEKCIFSQFDVLLSAELDDFACSMGNCNGSRHLSAVPCSCGTVAGPSETEDDLCRLGNMRINVGKPSSEEIPKSEMYEYSANTTETPLCV